MLTPCRGELAGEFFLAADLSDGGAELVVGLDPVL
jgi:hypothetical protein